MRIFGRLINFAADVKCQLPGSRQFPVGARLDIGMERYNIAPVRRSIQYIDNVAEGLIEYPVDIHIHSVVSLKGLQKERETEAVFLKFSHVPVIGLEQNVFV
jgi:hypothetical protein